jgi:hypothetical protein
VSDDPPKSAYELAMERLRRQDRESGTTGERPLDDRQKAAIAEARKVAEARFAEREILFKDALRKAADLESAAALEEEYRRDRERIAYDRDKKIEEVRGRSGA